MNETKKTYMDIEQAYKRACSRNNDVNVRIRELLEENKLLKEVIAQCRCEECGDELGDATDFTNGILCRYCSNFV